MRLTSRLGDLLRSLFQVHGIPQGTTGSLTFRRKGVTFVCLVASFVLRRILRSPLMATVNLSLPDSFEGESVDVPQWAVLAANERNLQVTPDSLEDGDLVALEDRQSLSLDWPQRHNGPCMRSWTVQTSDS